YVRAVHDYAAVIAADPTAFDAYHRWDVYYRTTAGDVILPIGYESASRIPVDEYLAANPQ
ncbi:MAG: lytic transglycosylase domain-containing protein, partial [Mycobacterium sp.]